MKKYLIVMMVLFIASCADENLKPIVTFDDAGHGAYPRLISETGERNINFFDPTTSTYSYSVEFIDDSKGNNVATYLIELEYVDVNGVNSKPATEYKSFPASGFATSDNGYKAVNNIDLIATEMISFVGLTNATINQADKFLITGTLVMNDGSLHTAANSSATVKGSAFQGHFDVSFPVVCPSDLAGTHNYSTLSYGAWCSAPTTQTGESVWVTESNGVYSVDGGDYAFGAYYGCYGSNPTLPGGNLRINDLCNELYWTGNSRWGEVYTFNSLSVSGADLSFDWSNDYGEAANTTITREGGANWPPLFIK